MNAPNSRSRLRSGRFALLGLACLFLNAACAEDPFTEQAPPGLVGRDNSLTDPNATPPPEPTPALPAYR